jgi:hypothetical protein
MEQKKPRVEDLIAGYEGVLRGQLLLIRNAAITSDIYANAAEDLKETVGRYLDFLIENERPIKRVAPDVRHLIENENERRADRMAS